MLVFIINKIWEIDFIDESKFKDIFKLENELLIWNIIQWWILNISDKEFVEKLPFLNGFVNKYWFYDKVILPVDEKLIKLQNVYEIIFDEKEIKKLPQQIQNIERFLKSWKLLTLSKKEEFNQILDDSVYLVLQNIIKIYFIIYEAVKNKEELKAIISSDSVLQEYKSQASLLEYTSNINIEQLVSQMDFMIKQLSIIADFFVRYKKEVGLI